MSDKPPTPSEVLDELFTIGNLTDEQYRQVKRLRAENERLRAALEWRDAQVRDGSQSAKQIVDRYRARLKREPAAYNPFREQGAFTRRS